MHAMLDATVFGLAMIFVGAANVFHFKTEAELLAKKPELGDKIYFWGGVFRHRRLVERLYEEELPGGHCIRQSRLCAGVGFVAFSASVVLTFR
jgi:hypothetical protein